MRFINRRANCGSHVDAAVIGEEHLSSHGAFEHHWSGHFIVAQGSHESDRLP
jgi:hypothetical protein